MDWQTILLSATSGGIVGLAAVKWLGKTLVEHELLKSRLEYQLRLDQQLAATKSELDRTVGAATAQVQAELRLRVDDYLAGRSIERQYELDARRRLYSAIGPLRCQLVTACDDLANRIQRIGSGKQPYSISLDKYFGQSTVYRVLRVLAIADLIERQMAYADFSVDPSITALLQFRKSAFLCLSSSRLAPDHPNADWNTEVEHIFFDRLAIVLANMIVHDPRTENDRVLRFDEFSKLVATDGGRTVLAPIPQLFDGFTPTAKPILWIRLVALANLSFWFAKREGPAMGVQPELFEEHELLDASKDPFSMGAKHRILHAMNSLVPTLPSAAIGRTIET